MVRTTRLATLLIVMVAVGLSGCPRKVRVTDDITVTDSTVGDVRDEESLGREESTLERYKRGLGAEEGGVLKDVRFGYDSYELDGMARDILAANAQWLKENPGTRTEIEGHCDERGTIEYNLALGARRAKAAKDYLVSLGISPGRLSTISYGEELPICREPTESCYARNRRVHFIPPN